MRFQIVLIPLLTATLTYAQDTIILKNGDEIPAKVLEITQLELKYRKSINPEGPMYTSSLRDVLLIKYANGTKDVINAQESNAGSDRILRRSGSNRPPLSNAVIPPDDGQLSGGLRYRGHLFNPSFITPNSQRIGLTQAKSLFNNQPDAMTALTCGRSLRTWSVVAAVPVLALIGVGTGLLIAREDQGDRRDGMRRLSGDDDRQDDDRRGKRSIGAALVGGGALLGVASIWLGHRATIQFRRAANRYNNRQPTSLRIAPGQFGNGAVLTF